MSIQETIANIVEEAGARLYDIETVKEGGRTVFRVTITAQGGVDLEMCEKVSKMLSPYLDIHPPCGGNYFLEVSSPGIERRLRSMEHFAAAVGEKVKITLGDKRKLEGQIAKVEGDQITLLTQDGEITIDFRDIKMARTYFEW